MAELHRGVVDSDYQGEIKVILHNRGEEQVKFAAGDRVAQMILEKYEGVSVKRVEELLGNQRGSGKKVQLKVLRGCSVGSNSGWFGSIPDDFGSKRFGSIFLVRFGSVPLISRFGSVWCCIFWGSVRFDLTVVCLAAANSNHRQLF